MKKAFTLIELIIVVVIIGILALVAIPRYFANVAKAKQKAVDSTLATIRSAVLDYYAVNGVYPVDNTWPINVIIDGDTVNKLERPGNISGGNFCYYTGTPSSWTSFRAYWYYPGPPVVTRNIKLDTGQFVDAS